MFQPYYYRLISSYFKTVSYLFLQFAKEIRNKFEFVIRIKDYIHTHIHSKWSFFVTILSDYWNRLITWKYMEILKATTRFLWPLGVFYGTDNQAMIQIVCNSPIFNLNYVLWPLHGNIFFWILYTFSMAFSLF